MNYKEIYKKELFGPYFFTGEEDLLKDNATIYLKSKIGNFLDFNFIKLDGKSASISDLINACERLPMMNDKKMILIKDAGDFISSFDFKKDLEKIVASCPKDTILIFQEGLSLINKNNSFYKWFNKKDRIFEFSTLNPLDAGKYISGYLKRKNIEIQFEDAKYLAQRLGYGSKNLDTNLFDIKSELDKLANMGFYCIKKEDIDLVVKENINLNIFDFLEALANRNIKKSLDILENLYNLNESVSKILAMVTRQNHMILGVKLGLSDRSTDVMSILGIGNYEYKKFINYAKNFSKEELIDIYRNLQDVDYKIKTSSEEEKILLEREIVKICNKKG
ncbi:DNA polymerase III, delta subunit [Clostridiales bacterium KA00134]|nr:DNA polymerase III, delta subunit [Clostridiales bacterium KA00134]